MRMSQPGPGGQANVAPWRRWLLPAAVTAGLVALLALPRGAAPGMALSYTRFLGDVGAGTVRAVTIGPAGQVTGSLTGGQPFTTTIPIALGGNGLAGDLAAHHVQVTATAAMPSSLASALIQLLPLLLIAGLRRWSASTASATRSDRSATVALPPATLRSRHHAATPSTPSGWSTRKSPAC
jgi:FtsH-like protein